MKIPEYNECVNKENKGIELTALERFIRDQEPAGHGEILFREELQSVIDELLEESNATTTTKTRNGN